MSLLARCLIHRELRLSTGTAFYRQTAARLVQRFPEVAEALRDGRLCVTAIVEPSRVMNEQNRAEVLPRFFHASKQQAKAVAAELSPRPDPPVRTVVTALPPASAAPATIDRGLPLRAGTVPFQPVEELRPLPPPEAPPTATEPLNREQAFRLASGEVCGSTHQVELHHLRPWADGGTATADDLSLRCHRHHAVETQLQFGDGLIARCVERRRALRGEGATPPGRPGAPPPA